MTTSVLALELSTALGSVALLAEGRTVFEAEFANDRKHSGAFFENVQSALAKFARPTVIVAGLGPGSYAGSRIAIATAIGLRAATGARLLGLPSICALAITEEDYAVIGDARRDRFFFARVTARRCAEGPVLFTIGELQERLRNLDRPIYTSAKLAEMPEAIMAQPSAKILAKLAGEAELENAETLEPIYLRAPHVTMPKHIPTAFALPK